MNENEYISSLKARDIRPTALRVLILRTMAGFDRAFSLADLEEELDTVDKSTLFRTLTLFWRITWCTASTTVPVRSNMRFAAAIAIVKSTTCIPISIARIAGVPFACEGWLFRRWVCRTDFRPKRSISLSRGSAPTVRGGTDRMDRGGLSERRNPVRPGRKRSIKGPGISGGSFPAADVSRWRASCGSAPGRNSKCRIRGGIARRVSADSDDKRT